MNDRLACMVGRWSGEGHGVFPTIDAFVYRETLEIERRDDTSLFYLQKSERAAPPDGGWITSHSESGFIRQLEDGALELTSAHSRGRAEILRGSAVVSESPMVVEFVSTAVSNDPRVVTSARRWEIDADAFRYTMAMGTTRVPQLTPHLSAVLRRQRD